MSYLTPFYVHNPHRKGCINFFLYVWGMFGHGDKHSSLSFSSFSEVYKYFSFCIGAYFWAKSRLFFTVFEKYDLKFLKNHFPSHSNWLFVVKRQLHIGLRRDWYHWICFPKSMVKSIFPLYSGPYRIGFVSNV